jgi:hypothetical protein
MLIFIFILKKSKICEGKFLNLHSQLRKHKHARPSFHLPFFFKRICVQRTPNMINYMFSTHLQISKAKWLCLSSKKLEGLSLGFRIEPCLFGQIWVILSKQQSSIRSLAKFGYKLNMEKTISKSIPLYFWSPTWTMFKYLAMGFLNFGRIMAMYFFNFAFWLYIYSQQKETAASPPDLLVFHSIPKDFPSFPLCELERGNRVQKKTRSSYHPSN